MKCCTLRVMQKKLNLNEIVIFGEISPSVALTQSPMCRPQAESSPFVEKLLKKGYEVIYLTEPVDEYCIQALPEFDGKRFQNVAKEGVKFDESDKAKEKREAMEKEFEPLTTWLKDKALKDKVGGCFFSLKDGSIHRSDCSWQSPNCCVI